jgi:hypothetical protein
MRKLDKLAYPKLDIPTYQHVAIFRALGQVLRTDPIFPTACNLFLDWSGTSDDTKEPVHAFCPYCRITPGVSRAEMATERQHNAPLIVDVLVAVQGTNYDNLGNFWGLIHSAVWSQSNRGRFGQVNTILQSAGVTRPVMSIQGFFPVADNENNYMLIGNGQLTFNSLLPN